MTTGETVRIFSARACAEPLRKAARDFEEQTGIHVDISVCARHCAKPQAEEASGKLEDFLEEIAEHGVHDLAIGGAEYLLDDGEVKGIVLRGQRRTIAYRAAALVVPSGNPARIASIRDVCRPGVRVAISMIDCLKGVWEDVTARLGILDEVRPNITFRASGCVAIVEAVAEKKVDVAFGWAAFKHLDDARIAIVDLPPEQRVLRGTCVGLLSFSKNHAAAIRFMDFLTTPAARQHYLDHGWVLPRRAV
jgi:accessory colonization factor AcfC